MDEMLKVVDEQRKAIGIASREEVHKKGYWHETFHCWFLKREKDNDYIYFQLRSEIKKDFPSLLDITAAGHILADETVSDGIREVKEELGIDVAMESLVYIGAIANCIVTDKIIDKEFGHVFLYMMPEPMEVFQLQEEEVAGIVRAEWKQFVELCSGKREDILVKGFVVHQDGQQKQIEKVVGKQGFVPHQNTYLEQLVEKINPYLEQ
ncbi:MAG: NUDIX domain-containing protein [Bacillaceae bacterium]